MASLVLKSNYETYNAKNQKKNVNYVAPPFYQKVFLVWNAPYTKFWINFLCYIVYLMLFGLVTLWPCCGNLLLDSILWLWTATIAVEDTRIAYKKYLTGSQLPITASIIEIGIMILFLILFFLVRIIGSWDDTLLWSIDRIYASKAVLCIFLLYFYYRTLFIFLPISHQLGPMLVRMKLMIKHDFMTYLRLFLIFMTAGGIALNSILYPFHPVNSELLKKVLLFRGFLQIFALDKADLEKTTDDCKNTGLSHHVNKSYTCVSLTNGIDFSYPEERLKNYGVSYKCNYMSLMAWFILLQYFLLVKLFLPSLLTAMFSATGQRVSAKSEQLWMFQRYEIVIDYEKRLVFPPPFTLIPYTYMIIKWILKQLFGVLIKCKICCCYFCRKHNQRNESTTNLSKDKANGSSHSLLKANQVNTRVSIDKSESKVASMSFNYWRNTAQKYSLEAEKEVKEKAKQKQIETNLNKVREDLGSHKKSLQRLNDRVISLEKAMIQNQSYLEQIKNLLTQKVSKSGLLDRKKSNYIHILSRESPYLSTNIPRCFIYEKLVPWDCSYDLYDPPFIVIPAELFNVDKIFIDDDPTQKQIDLMPMAAQTSSGPPPPPNLNNRESVQTPPVMNNKNSPFFVADSNLPTPSTPSNPANQIGSSSTSNQKKPEEAHSDQAYVPRTRRNSQQSLQQQSKQNLFLWNSVIQIDNPNQPGKKITIDRKSWITRIDEKTSHSTFIYQLDSVGYPKNPIGRTGVRGRGALMRYGPNKEIMAIVTRWKKSKNKPIYVERRKLLEFIAVKDPTTGLSKIPGEKILGDESQFSVVCRTFMELVFEETDVEKGFNFVEEDMTTFFCSFASETSISPKNNKQSQLSDIFNDLGFLPTMIYSGYIDDPRNTDNAWIEAEIWNFHYDKEDFFDKRIKNPASKWREVSSNVRINSNEIIGDVLKEISEIHNGFYN